MKRFNLLNNYSQVSRAHQVALAAPVALQVLRDQVNQELLMNQGFLGFQQVLLAQEHLENRTTKCLLSFNKPRMCNFKLEVHTLDVLLFGVYGLFQLHEPN